MSRHIAEDNEQRQIARVTFGQRQLFRRPAERPFKGGFNGLIFPTDESVIAESPAGGWFLLIPADLNGSYLRQVSASFYVASATDISEIRFIRVRSTLDLLTTHITIDTNERNSFTAATPPVIGSSGSYQMQKGDLIYTEVVSTPGDAFGLEVNLAFA